VCDVVLSTDKHTAVSEGTIIFRFHADWIQPEQQDAGNFLPADKTSNPKRLLFASCYEHVSSSRSRIPVLGVTTYTPGGETNIQRRNLRRERENDQSEDDDKLSFLLTTTVTL
jgi:hypothetical protein